MTGFILILFVLFAGPVDASQARVPLLRSETVREAVNRFIMDRCDGSGDEVRVEFRSVPDSIPVGTSAYTLRVDDGGVHQLRGRATLLVDVLAEGRVDRRLVVSVTVRRFGSVLVASKQVERHATVGPKDVRLETMETTMLPEGVLGSTEGLSNLRTRRIINAGSVLTEALFEQLPIVAQGDIVKLVVRTKSVVLSLKGIAKEDGIQGSVIAVQKMGSHDRIKARVVAAGTVEVVAE